MAYKALYRTYRPDSFDEMAGQKHIVKTLKNAIENNRIAHAYLFCGPRGTGKTSVAKIFAKAVNCESNHKPCGHCDNCMEASEGTHPDIIEIDAASNNGVEEVRNLIEKVKYAPLKGKYKVYIIDEVHMMTAGAFNALLKTIEEPPAHVIFILATTEPYKVLPTIISRCQRFDFTKISRSEIVNRLSYVVEKEHINTDKKVLESIAILADGGMRDALSILDQCRAYAPDCIRLEDVNEIYGVISTQEVCDLIEKIKDKDSTSVIKKIEEFDKSGADIKRLTVDIIDILKESIIYDYSKNNKLLSILDSNQIVQLISNYSTSKRLESIDILMNTYEKYRQASNVISYFEICMLKIMNLLDMNEVISNVSRETLEDKPSNEYIKKYNTKEEKQEDTKDEYVQEELIVSTMEQVEEDEEAIETEEIKHKDLGDEFLLSLLVGANKQEKAIDNNALINVNQYLLDIKYAKYANLINTCNIVASSATYIVVKVNSIAQANEINDLDKNNEFIQFTNELFNKKKKIFAITDEKSISLISLFRERYANNTLPEPASFEEEIQVEEEEDEQIKTVRSLFDQIEIKED